MTVKRRLSRIFGSLRLKRKGRKVAELSNRKSLSQSQSQLIEDKDNSLDLGAEENYYVDYNEDSNQVPIVLFTQLQVEILPEATYPASPLSPSNKSGNNLIHSTIGTPHQSTNFAYEGDGRKIGHYEGEEAIGQIGSVPTTPTNALIKSTAGQMLKRRLSLKGLKKSGKGVLKVLKTGFAVMGNTNTMIQASLGCPQVYELAIAVREQRSREFDYTYGKYEQENEAYKRDYAEFRSRRQQESSRISRCEYDW